jgi:hypothetical protein
MPKPTALVKRTVKAYIRDLQEMFPGVDTEVIYDTPDGAEAWVRVEVPPDMMDRYEDIAETTPKLNYRYWDETDVFIVALVVAKEPAHV